jgi:NADPH:quinone reductase-like Zn-dependent oxidoreductase
MTSTSGGVGTFAVKIAEPFGAIAITVMMCGYGRGRFRT